MKRYFVSILSFFLYFDEKLKKFQPFYPLEDLTDDETFVKEKQSNL